MASQKEKDVWLNVLDLYKDMPHMWNKNDRDYTNKPLRQDGFRVLLEIYKSFDKDASIDTVKKKIENMRTTYKKEAKKVIASKHTGAGSEEVYVPSLWYFNALSFLECTTEPCRPVIDSIEKNANNENLSSSEEENSQAGSSRASPVPTKKKKMSFLQKQKNVLNKQENVLNKAEKMISTKEEEWEVIGKSIGLQLRDLKSTDLSIAQKLIADVIFYAKMGRLTEDTHMVLGLRRTSLPSPSPSLCNTTDNSSSSLNHIKFSHPSPQYSVVHRPHPSPQYHDLSLTSRPSPQYQIESPQPSPQQHVQTSNPSPQYHDLSLTSYPSPQHQIESPQPSPQQHVQTSHPSPQYQIQSPQPSSEFNLQEFEPPQIHIPDHPTQQEIEFPNQIESTLYSPPSHSSRVITQHAAISHRQYTPKIIDMKDFLIIKRKSKK